MLNQQTIRCQVLGSLNKLWSCLIFIKLYISYHRALTKINLYRWKLKNLLDSNSRLHTKGTMLWSYWLTIHKLIQFSDSFCILPHKVTFPIHHQAPYCPISNEMNLFPQTSFHRKTILFHLKILLLARLQCLLFTCNSHNGSNEFLHSKKNILSSQHI